MQGINFKVVVTSALATMFIAALIVVAAAQTGGRASAAGTAAVAAQAAATPSTGSGSTNGSTNPAPAQPQADTYYNLYLQNLATNLGVSQGKLTSGMTQAAKDTIAQAVKDGKLTQAQADQLDTQIDNMAANGIYGYNGFGHGPGMGGPGMGGPGRDGFGPGAPISSTTMSNVETAVASKLGLTVAQMHTDFQNGQTIADLAQAANVNLADIKTIIINTIKPDLDAAVKAGNMTQAQEDSFIQNIQNDTFTHPGLLMGGGRGHGGFGPGGPGAPNDNDSDDNGSTTTPSVTPSGTTN